MPAPLPTALRPPVRSLTQGLGLALFLVSLFWLAWPYDGPPSADRLAGRDRLPLELSLWLDPLAGLAAAVAARTWTVALVGAAATLAACAVLPRVFCGYVCPLGTLQDVVGWLVGRCARRPPQRPRLGGWRHLRFYLLAAVLVAAALGTMLAGAVAAIPLLTRGLVLSAGLLQVGWLEGWGLVGPFTPTVALAVALLALVLALAARTPRFWCRCVCPTGALLSLAGLSGVHRRYVRESCTGCGRCAAVCPFDAVAPDAGTRPLDCAFCQTCARACPVGAIGFGRRRASVPATGPGAGPGDRGGRGAAVIPDAGVPPFSRRAWLGSVAGGAASALAMRVAGAPRAPLLRPPGSVAEDRFADLCVRCGECLKVCPGSALQPAGWADGPDALWTPVLTPTQAGCHPDCNFCTQVCPTRAIVPLPLAAKRRFRVGLARIDRRLCLAHAGRRDCQLCFDECEAAGYHAIEMRSVSLPVGEVPAGAVAPEELEQMASIRAPFVRAEACVGCGLCEYRCHAVLHRQQRLLPRRAIVVVPEPSPAPVGRLSRPAPV